MDGLAAAAIIGATLDGRRLCRSHSRTLLRNALRSVVCDCNGRTATLLFKIMKINFARKPKENFDSEHPKGAQRWMGERARKNSSLVSEDRRLADERLRDHKIIAADLIASDFIARDTE